MPKMTIIDMVQSILSDMNEDEVNSLDDTPAANQVGNILKDTYYALINDRIWPTHSKLMPLVAIGDATYPTHMKLPDTVSKVNWIKYNMKEQMSDATGLEDYQDVTYMEPEAFVEMMYQRDADGTGSSVVIDNLTTTGVRLIIKTNANPTYWTSFDDEYVVFDSYNSTYDDTLQTQKSLASVIEEPSWTMSDTFIPDMPVKGFPLLLAEAKKAAFIKMKQASDPVEVERARRQRTWMAGEKHRVRSKGISYPNYGRK